MENLSLEQFKDRVAALDTQEWEFKGNRPVIIDFYADWCGPCKTITPILQGLSEEYKGRVDFFKVNVDENYELSSIFNIRSIPSLLFIPMNAAPQMHVGMITKDKLHGIINSFLLVGEMEKANI